MLKNNILSILVAIAIMYLSLASSDNFDEVDLFSLSWFDKIAHFGMYFALTGSILYGNRRVLETRGRILMASVIPLLYGILMEILQLYTSNRSGNIADAIADLTGIAFFVFCWMVVRPVPAGRSDADELRAE